MKFSATFITRIHKENKALAGKKSLYGINSREIFFAGGTYVANLINQIVVFFILIFTGVVIKKLKLVTDEFMKGLSNIIVYITLPAMLITSMNYDFTPELLSDSLLILLLGGLTHILLLGLSIILVKLRRIEKPARGILQYAMLLGNTAYMGYPIVEIAFGKTGVFYTAIFNIWFSILSWTVGIYLLAGSKEMKLDRKLIFNPGTISIMIGFFLFLFSIKLPISISSSLTVLGNTTIPLAMLFTGMTIEKVKLGDLLSNMDVVIYSVVKLLITPALVYVLLIPFDFSPVIKGIVILMSAMPAAVNTPIFAHKFGSDHVLASKTVVTSTLMGLVTLPAIMYFL